MLANFSSKAGRSDLNNSCNLSNSKIGGDFNFDGNQNAQSKVNFSCIQENKTSTDSATAGGRKIKRKWKKVQKFKEKCKKRKIIRKS